MPAAWKLKLSIVVEWLYMLREKREVETELQAALHGAKLKSRRHAAKPKKQSVESLAGIKSGQAFGIERIVVSKEELAAREHGKSN